MLKDHYAMLPLEFDEDQNQQTLPVIKNKERIKSIKIPRPVFVDRTEQNKKEDEIKAQHDAEEEEKRALHDPKFVKKRERLLAKIRHQKLNEGEIDPNYAIQ
jgi:hypothetical protein